MSYDTVDQEQKAVEYIQKYLKADSPLNTHKQQQLRELAEINGKETSWKFY